MSEGGLFSPPRPPRAPNSSSRGGGGGASRPAAAPAPPESGPVVEAIERIRKDREARRRSAQFKKAERLDDAGVAELGLPAGKLDRDTVEFFRMIRAFRDENARQGQPHAPPGEHSIAVVVRKRPINARELAGGDYDAVTCLNPRAIVHAPKKKVDGITRFLENTAFQFDHTFDENADNATVYRATVAPLVSFAFKGGRGTCFAYGQTGSGKTHTMSGVQALVAHDIFALLTRPEHRGRFEVCVTFFEIYGGRAFDVLHGRTPVIIREDEKHRVVASGLAEVVCRDTAALLAVIAQGNASRTTHSTEVNSQSSRSHAICEISLRTTPAGAASVMSGGRPVAAGAVVGSLSLIDLAGSERAADSRNHNQARRIESAEINKSLLALKECIRALAVRSSASEEQHVHVPFRASKLTLALRDSFESAASRVIMIATVSPCASSWDHTGNTLRYADRVKEQPGMSFDEEGRVMGGGGSGSRPGGGVSGVGKSYSFATADAIGSGAEGVGGGNGEEGLVPPRVSPVNVDGGGGIITGAKAPPAAIFKRERIAAQRAANAAAASASDEPPAPPARSSSSSAGGGASARGAAATAAHLAAAVEAAEMTWEGEEEEEEEGLNGKAEGAPLPSRGAVVGAASSGGRGSLMSPPLRVPVGSASAVAGGSRAPPAPAAVAPVATRPAPRASGGTNLPRAPSREQARPLPSDREGELSEDVDARRVSSISTAAAALPMGEARLMQRAAIGKPVVSVPHERPQLLSTAAAEARAPPREEAEGKRSAEDDEEGSDAVAAAAEAAAADKAARGIRMKLATKGRAPTPAATAAAAAISAPPTSAAARVTRRSSQAALVGGEEAGRGSGMGIDEGERGGDEHGAGSGGGRGSSSSRSRAAKAGAVGSGASSSKTVTVAVAAAPHTPPPVSTRSGGAHAPAGSVPSLGSLLLEAASSPQQSDIRALHESMRRSSAQHHAAVATAAATPEAAAAEMGAAADEDAADDDLLALHEAVGMIVDLEQELLDAHMNAIQENAELLTEEGKLLAGVQAASGGVGGGGEGEDYDMRAYAERLEALLVTKHETTGRLLERIARFKQSLAHEEMLSTLRGGGGDD